MCNATYLQKDKKRRPTKLDYICVTNRWKGMVLNVETKWGPAIHRFGQKFDHALVSAIWRWKTRKKERPKRADYAAMDSQLWSSFDDQLRIKLQKKMVTRDEDKESVFDDNGGVTDVWVQRRYTELTECVQATIAEVVPDKKNHKKW